METKEELINSIKKWVKIDNEIRTLQKEQLKRKKEKKTISENLIKVMREHEIDCFDINDGQIIYSKRNIKKPISKKILFSILSNFYNGDSEKAAILNDFILDNREETTKETIMRKIDTSKISTPT